MYDVSDDLDKELTGEDSLWPKVLDLRGANNVEYTEERLKFRIRVGHEYG